MSVSEVWIKHMPCRSAEKRHTNKKVETKPGAVIHRQCYARRIMNPVLFGFITWFVEHVKTPLEEYMAQYPKVKIVRLAKREGLIRARLVGLEHVTAPTVTYLDSHCECAEGTCKFPATVTSVVGQITNQCQIVKAKQKKNNLADFRLLSVLVAWHIFLIAPTGCSILPISECEIVLT